MFDFKEMNDQQKVQTQAIKQKAEELLELFNQSVPSEQRSEASRLMNIARTNLEQSIMWAIKGVSRV